MDKEVWSLVWKAMNFIILVVILYKLLAGLIRTFFDNRSLSIRKEIEEANRTKKEAERRYEELRVKLENIDKEIEKMTELFKDEGFAEKERIIENARKDAEKIREQATRAIEQEVIKARAMIREEYAELIVEMAENLIKKRLTNKDQQQIVEEYIEKVVQLN